MTKNDMRVMSAVEESIERGWDGFAPHGSADYTAIRRLMKRGEIVFVGTGECGECDSESHKWAPVSVPLYAPAKPRGES